MDPNDFFVSLKILHAEKGLMCFKKSGNQKGKKKKMGRKLQTGKEEGVRELDLIKWMPLVKKQIKMIHFHCCLAKGVDHLCIYSSAWGSKVLLVTKNKCLSTAIVVLVEHCHPCFLFRFRKIHKKIRQNKIALKKTTGMRKFASREKCFTG